MDPRRATLALLLAVPAASGVTLLLVGLTRESRVVIAAGLALVVFPFLVLRRLNRR